MRKIEKQIERILEDLIDKKYVEVESFLEDFKVSESTLKKQFKRVVKYIDYEYVGSDYSIISDVDLSKYISNVRDIAFRIVNDDDPINQYFLKNLFFQINQLPKRDDLKYKEIENFKEYEMTYSLVNEMAIRNKRVVRLIKIFHKLASKQDEKNRTYSEHKQVLKYNKGLEKKKRIEYENYIEHCNIYSKKKTIDKIVNYLKTEYMISPLECRVDGIDYDPKYSKYTTLQDLTSDSKDIKSIISGETLLNTNQYDNLTSNDTRIEKDGFILEQKKIKDDSNFIYSVIRPSFSRSIVDNNVTTLSINFSLPKEEINAYISHIKDSLYPHKQEKRIKTPEELTKNQNYISSFAKLKKEEIADYFFVYDFVTRRKDVLKSDYIQDKTISEIENGYKEDVEKKHLETIFKEKLLKKESKLGSDKIKRYYYTMLDYIEGLKYRELVNSAFYKPKIGDLRLLSTQEQQKIREKAIEGFEQNLSIAAISYKTGMSQSRLYALRKKYKEEKEKNTNATLQIKKRGSGAGRKILTEKVDEQIVKYLLEDDRLWEKNSVQIMIENKLRINLSSSSVVNYLNSKQIKFENKINHPIKQMNIKEWIELTFQDIKDDAKKENAIICWTDAFCKKTIAPNIYLTKLVVYPKTKFLFRLDTKHDIVSFIEFLKLIINEFKQKVYLIVHSYDYDNLLSSEQEKISDFLHKNTQNIKFYK